MPQKNECSNIKNLKGFLLFILLSLSTFFIANDINAADDFKSIMQLIEKGEKEKEKVQGKKEGRLIFQNSTQSPAMRGFFLLNVTPTWAKIQTWPFLSLSSKNSYPV